MHSPARFATTAAWLSFACVTPTALSASPSDPMHAPKRHSASAFFNTTSYTMPGGFAWSPDNQQLLVSSDETGIFNAYALTAANATKKPLTTSKTNSTFAVSWFPGDARALFTADEGGNEINHLFVRELSGATRDLTPAPKAKASFAGWSRDDQSFYVLTNERDPKSFDVYRYAAKDYARTELFRNAEAWEVDAVSPDGCYVALLKLRSSADSDIYLLDTRVAKPTPQLISKHEGDVAHGVFEFTPDSKQLVYSTDEYGEYTQAWSYDVATSSKNAMVKADWDVAFVTFSRSGRFRVWGINEDARTAVHILDVSSGREIALRDLPPGDIAQVRFSRRQAARTDVELGHFT